MSDLPGGQALHGYRLRDRDHLVAILRQAWITRGPSQAALGRRMGISRSQVSAWLNGTAGTVVALVFYLANALGYDLALIPREDIDARP